MPAKDSNSTARSAARSAGGTANLKPWKPGQSGNPKGRPKGSRDAINEAFLRDVADAWKKHGKESIEKLATENPEAFVKVVAALVPKDVNVKGEHHHQHDHEHRAVSETAEWVTDLLGQRPDRASKEPLPN